MTRKDYIAIAAVIKNSNDIAVDDEKHGLDPTGQGVSVVHNIARDIASVMLDDNPLFDKKKFLIACGLQKCLHSYCDDDARCIACGEQQ